MYEVKQTIPLFGGKPALYVEVEGRRQAIPPLLGAKPGDFIAVIRKREHDDKPSSEEEIIKCTTCQRET